MTELNYQLAREALATFLSAQGVLEFQMMPNYDQDRILLRMLIDQNADSSLPWDPLGELLCDFVNYRKIDGCAKNGINKLEVKRVGINGQGDSFAKEYSFSAEDKSHSSVLGDKEYRFETYSITVPPHKAN